MAALRYTTTHLLILCLLFQLSLTNTAAETGKVLFGLGPEASEAIDQPIVQQSPVKMLSSWYNGSRDLEWMQHWKSSTVPRAYAKGYALHLIIFSDDPEKKVQTVQGEACGREYPLTKKYLQDIAQLSDIFKGTGPLYVTVFTEFQTYPCQDNQWKGSENYYTELKNQYRLTRQIFRNANPNAKVSLGWGGWQARYNDATNQGGLSLFKHFEDVMRQSDFQSFQSMQSDHNSTDIKDMTAILSQYGPVMLSHYKPDNKSQQTFDRDLKEVFTDSYINEITSQGLFAMSFMDHNNLDKSEPTFELVKSSISKYATSITTLPLKAIKTPMPSPSSTPSPTATPQLKITTPEFSADMYIENPRTSFLDKLRNFFQNLFH